MRLLKNLRLLFPKKLRLFFYRLIRFPKVGKVDPSYLLSLKPISKNWGDDRGTPIDRYYIEKFLKKNSDFIKGRVLEIGDNYYTLKYGEDKVSLSEILHADHDNPKATYVGDLTDIPQIGFDTFDCIILTQTLQVIPDLDSAVETLYNILKKDGVVLVTVPGISPIWTDKHKRWPDYWRFTTNSGLYLFNKKFDKNKIQVESYGNVFSSVAFLHGLAYEELEPSDLEYRDENYQMLITIKATK